MIDVLGTQGYENAIETFAKCSLALDFEYINQEFLSYLPSRPSLILDVGAGVGQNANAMAELGHRVVAVEPLKAFLDIAKTTHTDCHIEWIQDALPSLKKLTAYKATFHFILLDGVWHHLHPDERAKAISRIQYLLHADGVCAISLRNGPAGAGKFVFPTSVEEIKALSEQSNLKCEVISQDQPSKLKNKEDVTWSRVILKT